MKLWKKLPRTLRGLVWMLLSLAAAVAIYTFLGAPVFSLEAQLRRAERAAMVGPGKILGQVNLEEGFGSYRKMLLAETADGVIFFGYDHYFSEAPELIYREKTGDLTLLCAPWPNENREQQTTAFLPVVLFADDDRAARAEIELRLAATYRGQTFEKTYRMEARREMEGCFVFYLTAHDARGLGLEGTAIQRFVMLSGYSTGTYSHMELPATVRLYDENGVLLTEETITVRSVAALAREAEDK